MVGQRGTTREREGARTECTLSALGDTRAALNWAAAEYCNFFAFLFPAAISQARAAKERERALSYLREEGGRHTDLSNGKDIF